MVFPILAPYSFMLSNYSFLLFNDTTEPWTLMSKGHWFGYEWCMYLKNVMKSCFQILYKHINIMTFINHLKLVDYIILELLCTNVFNFPKWYCFPCNIIPYYISGAFYTTMIWKKWTRLTSCNIQATSYFSCYVYPQVYTDIYNEIIFGNFV